MIYGCGYQTGTILVISASTVVLGLRSKFFTSTSSTAGETNAGSFGPSVISFTPSDSNDKQDEHRLLLVPCDVVRDRQFVDADTECLGERLCNHDQRVAVIALPCIENPGNPADGTEIERVVAVLGTALP